MEKDFDRFQTCMDALVSSLDNGDELNVDEKDISELVKELIGKKELVKGTKYNFPEKFYFLLGEDYLNKEEEINKEIKKISRDQEHRLIIIVESISEKLKINLPKKCVARFIYARKSRKDRYKVHIDSRLNSMIIDSKEENEVYPKGQIFVANLFDLVELYNEMGDSIFEKNVRYSLDNDKNDVESAIHETLKDEPQNFWFYNNGITLLADSVDYRDNKCIEICASSENKFSIINGAQTITACADFFYSEIDNEFKETAKSAYVMLRIITVSTKNEERDEKLNDEKRKLENKISISLNRQKPIDAEDLAINSELVYTINNLEIDNAVGFHICRKGESRKSNSYMLTEVARYVLASKLQKPGAAKNTYRGYILKMDGDSFKKKEIFPKFRNSDVEKEFINQYGLVNLSNILFEGMKNKMHILVEKNQGDNESKNTKHIFENGHYYFISTIVRALFMEDGEECIKNIELERVKMVLDRLDDDKMMEDVLHQYKELIDSVLKNEEYVDYNDVKKDVLYEKIISSQEYLLMKKQVRNSILGKSDKLDIETGMGTLTWTELIESFV